MFRKILYPTDFSEDAGNALEYVKKLKDAGTEEVVILYVVHASAIDSVMEGCVWAGLDAEECREDVLAEIIEKKEQAAKEVLREIEKVGIKGKVLIKVGKPANEILRVAEEEKTSLIIMGAHGEGKLEHMLTGSVSENVVRHANVPVMLVR